VDQVAGWGGRGGRYKLCFLNWEGKGEFWISFEPSRDSYDFDTNEAIRFKFLSRDNSSVSMS